MAIINNLSYSDNVAIVQSLFVVFFKITVNEIWELDFFHRVSSEEGVAPILVKGYDVGEEYKS